MYSRLALLLLLSSTLTVTTFGQKVKVIRKGWKQTNVVHTTTVPKAKYSVQQLSGKWQEISRTNRSDNNFVSFTDTMFLYFNGNNVYTKDGVNMSLKGKAMIDNVNMLTAAADVYTIKSLDGNEVILDDGEKYVHRLIKKDHFWYESLPNTSIAPVKYNNPVSLNLKYISGKWMVYRRDAKPGSVASPDYLIKEINITSIKDENNAAGEVTYNMGDQTQKVNCTITREGSRFNIISDKYTWTFHNYKADGTEFIFGDPDLMYFSKPS